MPGRPESTWALVCLPFSVFVSFLPPPTLNVHAAWPDQGNGWCGRLGREATRDEAVEVIVEHHLGVRLTDVLELVQIIESVGIFNARAGFDDPVLSLFLPIEQLEAE